LICRRAIDDFWNWFTSVSSELVQLYAAAKSSEIAKMLDKRVGCLVEGSAWEIGPGSMNALSFTISPDGDRSRLCDTEFVVSCSPQVRGWEFHDAKPPKPHWNFRFMLTNTRRQIVEVNASGWRYSLIAFDQRRFFDLTLYADELPSLDDTAVRMAASIVVCGAIGERALIEKIGNISLHHGLPSGQTAHTGSVRRFAEHMAILQSER
jgi:hypothetical protein